MSPATRINLLPAESHSLPAQTPAVRRKAVALCAVSNFTALRRRYGQTGWQSEMDGLIATIAKSLPGAVAQRIAPDCVQIELTVNSAEELHAILASAAEASESDLGDVDRPACLGLMIGAALADDNCDSLLLQEQAERALAEACSGKTLVVTDVDGDPQMFEEIAILRDLPTAAANGELFLLYQPKVHIREQRIASAEALIRWLHPIHGLIMPDAFITAADESGDILPIALWTLDRVIADHQALCARGHRLRLFVNISGRLLTDAQFIETACDRVQQTGADIGFEITETSVISDPDLAISNLERCAAAGIELAIDDYGSGLSSLAYLKRLPAHELKIDKQFVTQLTSSHRDPLIVRSTIDLAHALDMEVTAEGVETPAALALLSVMGCEMVQGYLISAPLPFGAFANYMDEYRFDSLEAHRTPTVLRPASFWKRAG